MRKILEACPTCGAPLQVTRLQCPICKTAIEGKYEPCTFCTLSPDSLTFVETFVKCRGNIKEMERELGISYPTVRSRLNAVIRELGYEVEVEPEISEDELLARRQEILDRLEKGEINPSEATKRLAELKP